MRCRWGLFPLLLAFCGCWALLEGPAGDKALRILNDYKPRVERPSVIPKAGKPAPAPKKTPISGRLHCTLEKTVELAIQGNRDFLSRKEDLYLQALSMAASRYEWDPQLTGTVSYLFEDTRVEGARGASSGTVSAGVQQRLPWGGRLSLQGSSTATQHHAAKQNRSATSSLTFSWDQPLLRGFGPSVALETLIQARRNLLYELRRFELYRQTFAIQILSRFFTLVRLENVLENSRHNFETFEFQFRQSKALFAVGRVREVDLFRAEREMELARNNLEEAKDTLEASLDDFKVFLGLDTAVTLVVVPPEWMKKASGTLEVLPAPARVPFALSECIDAGLQNRLDLKNVRNALEDAQRAVSVAGNNLFPELDFNFGVGLDHAPIQDYEETNFDAHLSAGLRLGIPWDFRPERDAFFRARITEARARRATALMEEQIRQDIRQRYRAANQVRLTLYIQNKIRRSAEKRLRIAKYRFREGEIGNRDVVEAQEALLQAENRYIQALTDRRIRDLELAKAIGILRVESGGLPLILGWPGVGPEEKKPPEGGTGEGKGKETKPAGEGKGEEKGKGKGSEKGKEKPK
ncbi:MAG: TolC family protein [Planctomycetota bacterium]|jgi:outer membrane protein TolC